MLAERTFWEKATAIHVFCRSGKVRNPDHFSRHWYDLVGLERAGHVQPAITDRELAHSVASLPTVIRPGLDASTRFHHLGECGPPRFRAALTRALRRGPARTGRSPLAP